MRRALPIVVLCLIAFPAHAAPCWIIRQYVAAYGEPAALHWAKSHGYSASEIERAKRCLAR